MAIHHDAQDFAAATPDQIRVALLSGGVWQRYAKTTGALSHELEVEASTTHFRRIMSADPLPGPVRGLVGQTLEIEEVIRWLDPSVLGTCKGEVQVGIVRPRVEFHGELVVEPSRDGSRLSIRGPKPSTPLVARPLMPVIKDTMQTAMGRLCHAIRDELEAP